MCSFWGKKSRSKEGNYFLGPVCSFLGKMGQPLWVNFNKISPERVHLLGSFWYFKKAFASRPFWQKATFGGQSGVRGLSFLPKEVHPLWQNIYFILAERVLLFWQKGAFLWSVGLFGLFGQKGGNWGVKRALFGLYSWALAFFWEKLRLMDSFEFLGAFFPLKRVPTPD